MPCLFVTWETGDYSLALSPVRVYTASISTFISEADLPDIRTIHVMTLIALYI